MAVPVKARTATTALRIIVLSISLLPFVAAELRPRSRRSRCRLPLRSRWRLRLTKPRRYSAVQHRGDLMADTRVAIAGLGAVGRVLAQRLAAGIPGLQLAAVAARDIGKAHAWLEAHEIRCRVVPLAALPQHADLAV